VATDWRAAGGAAGCSGDRVGGGGGGISWLPVRGGRGCGDGGRWRPWALWRPIRRGAAARRWRRERAVTDVDRRACWRRGRCRMRLRCGLRGLPGFGLTHVARCCGRCRSGCWALRGRGAWGRRWGRWRRRPAAAMLHRRAAGAAGWPGQRDRGGAGGRAGFGQGAAAGAPWCRSARGGLRDGEQRGEANASLWPVQAAPGRGARLGAAGGDRRCSTSGRRGRGRGWRSPGRRCVPPWGARGCGPGEVWAAADPSMGLVMLWGRERYCGGDERGFGDTDCGRKGEPSRRDRC
jgi:hypothetical protein